MSKRVVLLITVVLLLTIASAISVIYCMRLEHLRNIHELCEAYRYDVVYFSEELWPSFEIKYALTMHLRDYDANKVEDIMKLCGANSYLLNLVVYGDNISIASFPESVFLNGEVIVVQKVFR
jgi:hypothetical protein